MFLYFTTFTSHSFHILFLTDQMKGFVSIFQLLGRYVRRISVVFHRNFTRRDNQHVRFSLHKQCALADTPQFRSTQTSYEENLLH